MVTYRMTIFEGLHHKYTRGNEEAQHSERRGGWWTRRKGRKEGRKEKRELGEILEIEKKRGGQEGSGDSRKRSQHDVQFEKSVHTSIGTKSYRLRRGAEACVAGHSGTRRRRPRGQTQEGRGDCNYEYESCARHSDIYEYPLDI